MDEANETVTKNGDDLENYDAKINQQKFNKNNGDKNRLNIEMGKIK